MSNGDTPGGGGGSAPEPNNDFFPTPISPQPVTEGNAPAPLQAPPQASPMNMQPFPLEVGPPRDEDHFNERKAGWKRVFEQLQTNPALNQALLAFGTQAMQPTAVRGGAAQVGQLGQALGGAAETYGAVRAQQAAAAEQQRKAGLEERRVQSEERRTDTEAQRAGADIDRIRKETKKLDMEIEQMPEALKQKYKLQTAQINEAIASQGAHAAAQKLAEVRLQIAQDPERQKLELDKLRAEVEETKARATQAREGRNADERKIQYLTSTLHMDAEDAANLVLGHGTAITSKAKERSAQQTAKDVLAEWESTGGKDERGKPISWPAWKAQKMQDLSFSSGGHADTGLISEFVERQRAAAQQPGAGAPGADDPRVQAIVQQYNASKKTPEDRAKAAEALKALGINE